jgi:hypothetical protein
MKGPVVLVAVTLAAAIVLTILLLFASSAGSGNDPPLDVPRVRHAPADGSRPVDNPARHGGVTNGV